MLAPVGFSSLLQRWFRNPSWTSGCAFVTGKAICLLSSVHFNFCFKSIFSLLLVLFWPWQQQRQKGKGSPGLLEGELTHSAGGQSHERAVLVPRVGKELLSTASSCGPSGSVPQLALCSLRGEENTTQKQNHSQFICRGEKKKKVEYIQRKRCPGISQWGLVCGWIRPEMFLQGDLIVTGWDTLLPHAIPPRCPPLFFYNFLNFDVGCRKTFILSTPLGEELGLFCHQGRVHTVLGFLHFSARKCKCDRWTAWVSSQRKTGTFVKSDRALRMEEQFPT